MAARSRTEMQIPSRCGRLGSVALLNRWMRPKDWGREAVGPPQLHADGAFNTTHGMEFLF